MPLEDIDVSDLIEQDDEFEERAGIRLDALSATLVGFFQHETIQVYGEVRPRNGDTLEHDVDITVAVYDTGGKIVAGRNAMTIEAASFFKFELFGVQVNGPVKDVKRILIVPKAVGDK